MRSLHRPLLLTLNRPLTGYVLSLHARAVNLMMADGQIISLVAAALGNGPATMLLDAGLPFPWQEGDRVTAVDGQLWGPKTVIHWGAAPQWEPPPAPEVASRERLAAIFAETARALEGLGSAAGILPAALAFLGRRQHPGAGLGGYGGALLDLALAGIAHLDAGRWEEGVRRLAGLGPGLTPSGDDLLAGFVSLLHRAGAPGAAGLSGAIRSLPATASPPFSLHLLRWAADGVCGEHHLAWLDALLAADSERAPRRLPALLAHGATSGSDWAAGVLLALHQRIKENENGRQAL